MHLSQWRLLLRFPGFHGVPAEVVIKTLGPQIRHKQSENNIPHPWIKTCATDMIYYLIFIFFLEVFPRPSPNNEPIIKRTSRKQLKPVTCNDSLQKKKKKKHVTIQEQTRVSFPHWLVYLSISRPGRNIKIPIKNVLEHLFSSSSSLNHSELNPRPGFFQRIRDKARVQQCCSEGNNNIITTIIYASKRLDNESSVSFPPFQTVL